MMAGHSKWANIRFRKMGRDAKRGKLFTKLIREITVSASQGGSDPSANPRLRAAIEKALDNNMTRDTIDKAIKRGAGGQEGQDLEEIRYEGYGPGGVAIMVECMTNNRKRTVSEVRHAFVKHGGNLGTDGSVAYLFKEMGQIVLAPEINEDEVLTLALEAGAEDIKRNEEGAIEVQTPLEAFHPVKHAFQQAGLCPLRAEITFLPSSLIILEEQETAEKLNKLIDSLEDLDDVQTVYSNGDISEDILSTLNLEGQ
jgi:YebC/PmpR family DNA-binding regulatory protein